MLTFRLEELLDTWEILRAPEIFVPTSTGDFLALCIQRLWASYLRLGTSAGACQLIHMYMIVVPRPKLVRKIVLR